MGDQQVIDVELDRNTDLGPITHDYRPPSWEGDSSPANVVSESKAELPENAEGRSIGTSKYFQTHRSFLGYVTTLRSLLPLVPMTMKGKFLRRCFFYIPFIPKIDVSGRSLIPVSYKLVANPAQFRNLVTGRRKAIEVYLF